MQSHYAAHKFAASVNFRRIFSAFQIGFQYPAVLCSFNSMYDCIKSSLEMEYLYKSVNSKRCDYIINYTNIIFKEGRKNLPQWMRRRKGPSRSSAAMRCRTWGRHKERRRGCPKRWRDRRKQHTAAHTSCCKDCIHWYLLETRNKKWESADPICCDLIYWFLFRRRHESNSNYQAVKCINLDWNESFQKEFERIRLHCEWASVECEEIEGTFLIVCCVGEVFWLLSKAGF